MDFLPSSSTSPAVTISLPNGIWDIPTLLRKSLKVSPTRDGVPKAEASRLSMSRAQSNIQEAIKECRNKLNKAMFLLIALDKDGIYISEDTSLALIHEHEQYVSRIHHMLIFTCDFPD